MGRDYTRRRKKKFKNRLENLYKLSQTLKWNKRIRPSSICNKFWQIYWNQKRYVDSNMIEAKSNVTSRNYSQKDKRQPNFKYFLFLTKEKYKHGKQITSHNNPFPLTESRYKKENSYIKYLKQGLNVRLIHNYTTYCI